jgi:mycoredoxin
VGLREGKGSAYRAVMALLDLVAGRPKATPHATALAHAQRGVAVYWRPGCPFTARLRLGVRAHRDKAAWVNIWEDDEGRAFVAGVNGGNETVPTVVIDGVPHTNPDPSMVKAALTR